MYTVALKGMSADNVLSLGVVSDFAGSGVAGAPGFSGLPGSPGALPSVPSKCRSYGAFPPDFQREAGTTGSYPEFRREAGTTGHFGSSLHRGTFSRGIVLAAGAADAAGAAGATAAGAAGGAW